LSPKNIFVPPNLAMRLVGWDQLRGQCCAGARRSVTCRTGILKFFSAC